MWLLLLLLLCVVRPPCAVHGCASVCMERVYMQLAYTHAQGKGARVAPPPTPQRSMYRCGDWEVCMENFPPTQPPGAPHTGACPLHALLCRSAWQQEHGGVFSGATHCPRTTRTNARTRAHLLLVPPGQQGPNHARERSAAESKPRFQVVHPRF